MTILDRAKIGLFKKFCDVVQDLSSYNHLKTI